MAYNPSGTGTGADRLAIARLQGDLTWRLGTVPALDAVILALSQAGVINLVISATAPTSSQDTTAWLQPNTPSYDAQGIFKLWNGSAYVNATQALFARLLAQAGGYTTVTFRSGAGAPGAGVGVDGDYYQRTDTPGGLYGPKAAGAWPANPITHTANANMLSGTGAPGGGTGVDGDFYARTDAPGGLYGPKAGGSWPANPIPGTLDRTATVSSNGQCILLYGSATAIALQQRDGQALRINGTLCTVPGAGVNGTNGGLAASTLYYVYARDSNADGVVDTLEFSATPYATHTDGTKIKSGDATRALVGMVRTNGSAQFVDTQAQRFVRSWFNDPGMQGGNVFTATRTGNSTTYAEVHSEIRCEFLAWADDIINFNTSGIATCDTSTGYCFTGISIDGSTTVDFGPAVFYAAVGPQSGTAVTHACRSGLSEGYHYATVMNKRASTACINSYTNADFALRLSSSRRGA